MSDITVAAIAAMDTNRVIGFQNGIPWKIPGEQKYFAEVTRGHTVLMGRKTYDSLPESFRPLPQRWNVVATRDSSALRDQGDSTAGELGLPRFISDPLAFISACKEGRETIHGAILWVIGGQQIYEQTCATWDQLYLTVVNGKHSGDAYFPDILEDFEVASEKIEATHRYLQMNRR